MPFKIYLLIIGGVLVASSATVWIASLVAAQLPTTNALAGFVILALAASLVIRKFNG